MKTAAALLTLSTSTSALLTCRTVENGVDKGDVTCGSAVKHCTQQSYEYVSGKVGYFVGCDEFLDCALYDNAGGDGCNDIGRQIGFVDQIKCSSGDFGLTTEAEVMASLASISEDCTPRSNSTAGLTSSGGASTGNQTVHPSADAELEFPECAFGCASDPEGWPLLQVGDLCGFLEWREAEPRGCLASCGAAEKAAFEEFYDLLGCGVGETLPPPAGPAPIPGRCVATEYGLKFAGLSDAWCEVNCVVGDGELAAACDPAEGQALCVCAGGVGNSLPHRLASLSLGQ